jgi:cellulase
MPFILNIATLLGAFTSTALAHGYVNGIVADGVYTQGWLVSYYYDNINGVPVPDTPGWYEESTDLGFISPTDYQFVATTIPFPEKFF